MHQTLNPSLAKQLLLLKIRFCLNYLITNALILITEKIQAHLDNEENTNQTVFVYLKKTLDAVGAEFLQQKLEYYGIRGIAKQWFNIYLKNARQYMTDNDQILST